MPKQSSPTPVNTPDFYTITLRPFVGPEEKRQIHLSSTAGGRIQDYDKFPPIIYDTKRLFLFVECGEWDAIYTEAWFEATHL